MPVDRVAIGAVMIVRPGEKIPLDGDVVSGRSDVNQAPITGESLPGRQGAGRRGLRRHHQRSRRARGRGHAPPARHDARAHHPPGGDGAGAARARAAVHRSLRALVHAGGHRARHRRRDDSAARARRAIRDLVLPRARAARDFVPVRAGDLDAGVDRVGAGRRGAARRAHQGRHPPRTSRGRSRHRVRQDRHADAGAAARVRRCAR